MVKSQSKLKPMKIVLVLLVTVCAVYAQSVADVAYYNSMTLDSNNCLQVEGKDFGCLLTTNLYCENQLYYQLISAQVDSAGFVLASGLLEPGYVYEQCFGEGAESSYICLEFGAGSVGEDFMSIGYITLYILDHGALQTFEYRNEVVFYSDAVCGSANYISPPCAIYDELEYEIATAYPHNVPANFQGLIDYLASPETEDPYRLVVGPDNCVYAGVDGFISNDDLPLYCPDIWYNPCSDYQNFKTRVGLYIEAAFGTGWYCGNLPTGKLCVSLERYVSMMVTSQYDTTLREIEASMWVYLMKNDYDILDQVTLSLAQTFPVCSANLRYSCTYVSDTLYTNSFEGTTAHAEPAHNHDDDDDDNHHHHSDSHHSDSHHHSSGHHSDSKHKDHHDSSSGNLAAIVAPIVIGSAIVGAVAIGIIVAGVVYYHRRKSDTSKIYAMVSLQ